jgi:hypothetical protein
MAPSYRRTSTDVVCERTWRSPPTSLHRGCFGCVWRRRTRAAQTPTAVARHGVRQRVVGHASLGVPSGLLRAAAELARVGQVVATSPSSSAWEGTCRSIR